MTDHTPFAVMHHEPVTTPEQAPHPAGAPLTQSDHAELHLTSLSMRDQRGWVLTMSALGRSRRLPFPATSPQMRRLDLRTKLDEAIKSWRCRSSRCARSRSGVCALTDPAGGLALFAVAQTAQRKSPSVKSTTNANAARECHGWSNALPTWTSTACTVPAKLTPSRHGCSPGVVFG